MTKLFADENTNDFNMTDFQKKIEELKAIEKWLELNLSTLQATIQALEVQLNTLNTLKELKKGQNKNFQEEINRKISELTLSTASSWWSQIEKNMNIVLGEVSNKSFKTEAAVKPDSGQKEHKNSASSTIKRKKATKKCKYGIINP